MIYMTPKENGGFTMVDNAVIRDNRLSLQAKGLLWYMLSCVDDWDFSAEKLQHYTNTKRSRIETALNELEEFGYIKREKKKVRGKYKIEITVYEKPRTTKTYLEELKEVDDSICPF